MSKDKIKIVIADNIPLTPHRQGGPVRIFKNFTYLPEMFDVHYIGCSGSDTRPEKGRIKEMNVQTVRNRYIHYLLYEYLLKQNNRFLRGGSWYDTITRSWMLFHRGYNRALKAACKDAKILVASHPWTFTSLKDHKAKDALLVYDAHNCEYQLVKEKYGGLLGWLVKFWTYRIERQACRQSDIILACSDNERKNFRRYYGISDSKIVIVPNSVETWKFTPTTQDEKKRYKQKHGFAGCQCALFIATNYFPNNEAGDYIVKHLAPRLPHIHFIIIGSIKVHFQRSGIPIPQNVHIMGQLQEEHMQELAKICDIALNPITLGSGTNIKLLDYMSWGIPTVTTARGVRGIRVMNHREVVIAPRTKFFGEVFRLFKRPDIRKEIARNGIHFVKKRYDARHVGGLIGEILLDSLKNIKNP